MNYLQIENDLANPEHPMNRFATGNKDTLEKIPQSKGINVRNELLKFHDKFYSANLMTLCIIGSQSLQELESYVLKYFSEIPNKQTTDPALRYWGLIPPFLTSDSLGTSHDRVSCKVIEIVPVEDVKKLTLAWPIWIKSEEERNKYLHLKPETIISHLIGHEGSGSINSYLKLKNWGNSVQASVTTDTSDLQWFEVSVALTKEGFINRYVITDIIFAYINLLQNTDIPKYIYDEVSQLSQISFNFSEKADSSDYVTRLVSDMQVYKSPAEYLIGSRLFLPSYRPNYEQNDKDFKSMDILDAVKLFVKEYLFKLNSQNLYLFSISKDFSDNTTFVSKYYGTAYNNYTSPYETLRWSSIDYQQYPMLKIPKKNILIPTNFDLIADKISTFDDRVSKNVIIDRIVLSNADRLKKERDSLLEAPPTVILNDTKWLIYHKLDRVFKQPKVHAIFSLIINKNLYDIEFLILARLFIINYLDNINEYLYDASLAGLRYEISCNSRGLDMVFSGYSDKIDLFIKQLMDYLVNFKVNVDSCKFILIADYILIAIDIVSIYR